MSPADIPLPRWEVWEHTTFTTASLTWGVGVILRATRQRKVWRVDYSGSYRTLADAAAARGFPRVGHPIDDPLATERTL